MMNNRVSTTLPFLPTLFAANKFLVVSLVFAALLGETSYKTDALECSSNSACSFGKYCCKKRFSYESKECKSDCIGEYCSTRSDCGGPRECCSSSKRCTTACGQTDQCSSNSDCSFVKYCCKKRFSNEIRECKSNCIGETCFTDNDCGAPREYCSSKKRCTTKSDEAKGIASWVAAVIVIGVVFGIAILVVIVCCRRRSTPGVIHRPPQNPPRETIAVVLQNTQNQTDPAQLQSSNYLYDHCASHENSRSPSAPAFPDDNALPYHSNPGCPAYSGDNPPPYQNNPHGENIPAYQTNPSAPYPDDTPPYHRNPFPQ